MVAVHTTPSSCPNNLDIKTLVITITLCSVTINISGASWGDAIIKHSRDGDGTLIQRTSKKGGEKTRRKPTSMHSTVLDSLGRIFRKCTSINHFHLKLDNATDNGFAQEVSKRFMRRFFKILGKQQLEVRKFKLSCKEVEDKYLSNILSSFNPQTLQKVVLSAIGTPRNLNIDLRFSSMTAQWKFLKRLHSEFPITGSWWDHIPEVSLKVTEMCRDEFEWFLMVLNNGYNKCKALRLHAEHLELNQLDLEAILGVKSGDKMDSLIFPMENGFVHCVYKDFVFDLIRMYDNEPDQL